MRMAPRTRALFSIFLLARAAHASNCAGQPEPARGIVIVSAANHRYADKELTVLVAAKRRLEDECWPTGSSALVSYDIGLKGCFADNQAVFAAAGIEVYETCLKLNTLYTCSVASGARPRQPWLPPEPSALITPATNVPTQNMTSPR